MSPFRIHRRVWSLARALNANFNLSWIDWLTIGHCSGPARVSTDTANFGRTPANKSSIPSAVCEWYCPLRGEQGERDAANYSD